MCTATKSVSRAAASANANSTAASLSGQTGETKLGSGYPVAALDNLSCAITHRDGLEFRHVHGDLSPANILMLPQGSSHCDIVDFGEIHDGRLWTPATTAADWVIGNHGSVSQFYAAHAPNTEQRPERERIVAGPKLRQAIDELKEQLATTGT